MMFDDFHLCQLCVNIELFLCVSISSYFSVSACAPSSSLLYSFHLSMWTFQLLDGSLLSPRSLQVRARVPGSS